MRKCIEPSALVCVAFLCIAVVSNSLAQTPPTVTNVVAVQRDGTFLVDITYDLIDADNDTFTVTFWLSTDAGQTYPTELILISGDTGQGQVPGIGKTAVWDAGAGLPEFFSTECSIRVVAEEMVAPPPVTLIVLLDRSVDPLLIMPEVTAELGDFFLAPGTDQVSVGMTYFPHVTEPLQCDPSYYNPPHEAVRGIPAQASGLIDALSALTVADDVSPMYPAFQGSISFACQLKELNPNETVAVVLIANGPITICETSIDPLVYDADQALSEFGVLTYTVGLENASHDDMMALAVAGGTGSTYPVNFRDSFLYETMVAIAAHAATH